MVLLNASKAARHSNSLINKPNCGGTSKKGGLMPRIGTYMPSNPRHLGVTNTQYGLVCTGNYTNGSQSVIRRIRRG